MAVLRYPNTVRSCCARHIPRRRQSCIIRSPTLLMTRPTINKPVLTTHLLSILLTNPAWLASSDRPMSQNPLCHPPSDLSHLPTPVTLSLHTHLPPLPRGTHLTRPEIGWVPPSIPTRGSLSMGLWALLMGFMRPFMTAGEYGGLSCTTERMRGVTLSLQRCCIPPSTSLHSGRDSTL